MHFTFVLVYSLLSYLSLQTSYNFQYMYARNGQHFGSFVIYISALLKRELFTYIPLIFSWKT